MDIAANFIVRAYKKRKGIRIMEQKLKALSRENLLEVIGKMAELLSKEQRQELDAMVEGYVPAEGEFEKTPIPARMSQEFVDEKMEQLESWMHQIDEGEIYLPLSGAPSPLHAQGLLPVKALPPRRLFWFSAVQSSPSRIVLFQSGFPALHKTFLQYAASEM